MAWDRDFLLENVTAITLQKIPPNWTTLFDRVILSVVLKLILLMTFN